MIVISSTELRNNTEKYLDIAKTQKVVIQREGTDTFILTQETYLHPDDDFHRAISLEDFRKGAKEHIRKLYNQEKI
jgi:Phd_YefM.